MIFYRVQLAHRDPADLLDPGHHYSHSINHDPGHTRAGISTCDSPEDLALYLASAQGAGFDITNGKWVIIELEGTPVPGAKPVDPEFETLVIPTAILSVTPVDEAFLATVDQNRAWLASHEPNMD